MNTTEEEKTLKPNIFKTIVLLIVSLVFVYLGFSFLKEEKSLALSWLIIIFFGIGAVVFIIQLLPNSAYLKLNSEGFEIKSLFKSNFTNWSDVEKFRLGYTGGRKMIMFNYTEAHNKYKVGKKLNKLISSNEAGLPNNYGMKADDLVDLMNEWKLKHS